MMPRILWVTLFSIAMGFMESAVVVYLRELYYPKGFNFPLVIIPMHITITELLREAATIVMLVTIGILLGRSISEKFAYFIFCFGIWDIFYYLFLKLLLNWPASLLTWDILFLIPLPWIGPVLAPVLVSLTFIGLAISIIYFEEKGYPTKFKAKETILFLCGASVIICSFIIDYLHHLIELKQEIKTSTATQEEYFWQEASNYIPSEYDWLLFSCGEGLLLLSILIYIMRVRKFIPIRKQDNIPKRHA